MRIQRVNKYYDFVGAKKFYKKAVLHHKQEHELAIAKMQKRKPLEYNQDFDESQFNAKESDKELCEAWENIRRSVHKEFLYYMYYIH